MLQAMLGSATCSKSVNGTLHLGGDKEGQVSFQRASSEARR